MAVDATDPTPASFKGAEAPGVEVSLAPGAYSVSETGGPDGYTGSFSAGCSGTIALGQTKTCTVTNDDQPAKLIVRKVVINDDGGTKTAADFSFEVNGGNPTAFEADGQNDLTVDAGSYSVTEPAAAGYTTTYDNCDNLALANGETKTCTITNNDQPAKLIVKKIVINDNGGTKTAADFSFKLNGGNATPFEADGQNDLTVNAGNYSVTEPAAAGYTTTYDNCSELVLANGAAATCTITNDDQPAKLIVRKIVINDNGGTKTAADFSFTVNGGSATAFEADGQNDLTVNAGGYSVTEPAAAGYTTSYDNCSELTLANGATATCTITNNDQPAKLIVKKIVINDNGGTKTAGDFTLAVNADSATPASFAGSTNGVTVSLHPGGYSVSETGGADGYTASLSADCVGTIALGETKTCVVTNDDVAGPPPPPRPCLRRRRSLRCRRHLRSISRSRSATGPIPRRSASGSPTR